jgi:hypothetical protein
MDKPKTTPKDFFLWAGAMVSLYGGVIAFISLLFDYINHAYPNPVANYYYDQSSSISYETASLIVLTPVFLVLMRIIRRAIAADPSRRDVWVRRWALFLTLFFAGAAMVVDLIVLINTYLQGEDLTVGFLLKVATVLLVAALGFMHFVADVWGYWEREPFRARMVNYGVALLVLVSIVAGFFIIGTPQQIRAQKQDSIRIQDLQNIQYQVVNYWQSKQKLPAALTDLNDPISNFSVPVDPQTGSNYVYKSTGTTSFQLCATFNAAAAAPYGGTTLARPAAPMPAGDVGKPIQDNWQHGAGQQCFDRTIDPQRYPPFQKTL